MQHTPESTETPQDEQLTRVQEFKAFMFILIFFFPIVTTIAVGGYGFIVWMSQILLGPPGHG